VGVLNLNPVDQATYDPFASTDPNVVQMLEALSSLGAELVGKANAHLRREVTFVTAGSQTSWALPADFVAVAPDTAWDTTGGSPMYGSVSAQQTATLKGSNSTGITTNVPYRIQGNRLVFPVAPSDGLTIRLEYVSEYWVQTAASGTGPDADHPTAWNDYVLFDPLLVVLGLKCRFLENKGRDTTLAYTSFADRLEWFQGKVGGSRVLALDGGSPRGYGINVPESFP
jgi:hypothetical protein